MSDWEETDFYEAWNWTPGIGKRKKHPKKDKKCPKRQNDLTIKTDENIPKKKKKKNSKDKEAMDVRKEKKKDKNKVALVLGDSCILPQGSSATFERTETSNPPGGEKLKSDCNKKTKRKKNVAFDLSLGNIPVKHPKCFSSSEQRPIKSILTEPEAVRDSGSCAQVTVTQAYESQCTSEDMNSQDLFITQKTFRTSPSESSSGETSDKAPMTSPQRLTPRNELHTYMPWVEKHCGGSYKKLHVQQQPRKTNTHVQKTNTVQVCFKQEVEEDGLKKADQNPRKGKSSIQTQVNLNANLTDEKKVSHPSRVKPAVVKKHLEEPTDLKPLPVAKSKKKWKCATQQSASCSSELSVPRHRFMETTSTQTENFFTFELCSYLNFYENSRVAAHHDELKPLDLSLPQRARKDLGMCLSPLGEIRGDNHKEPNLHESGCSDRKDGEVEKEPSGQHWSADMTTSSEDEPPGRSGKLDLTQVRAVQMRLNESFFFKTKGEGRSPRPESPLMKLAQGRELKGRKRH
ncbi:hypothetical protein F7725_022366 [Dissostichus mawsoni]|uniref:Uncharacterized protein n=1 Tax=Dissostichus mawsoni TaxID=36200 RepID=A0A7J5YZT1_DISMA|nr:hypothetical protein F7725_022366 [Dissostichus mawsoni]